MDKNTGSYDFDNFNYAKEEFERLKTQADIAAPFDREIVLGHGLKADMKVLEMGCGPGFVSRTLARCVPDGEMVGCDISSELLSAAKKYNNKNPIKNLRFIHGDIYNTESMNEKFDFIYSRFVFQHLQSPKKAIKNLFKLLEPGGRLVICDVDDQLVLVHPECDILSKIYKFQAQYQKELGGDRFVGRKIANYLEKSGFSDICIKVMTVSSLDLGMKLFLDLSTGYKLMLQKQENFSLKEKDIKQMYKEMMDKNHTGTIGLFHVSGLRDT